MKKLYVFIIFIIGITGSLLGQNDSIKKSSLLWEISGKDLKQKSYVFGTIHLIKKNDYFFKSSWQTSFEKCKVLILEANMNLNPMEQIGMAMNSMMLPNGATIEDYMEEDDYKKFKSFMLDSLEVNPISFAMYNMIKPFYSYSMVLTEILGNDVEMYEMQLMNKAKKRKMELIGLEDLKFQMALVDSIPVEEQIKMFLDFGSKQTGNILDEFNKLVAAYKTEDIQTIYQATQEEEEGSDFEEEFLIKRNKNWIPIIIENINKNSCFIAVGAGHLGGAFGVINLLKKEGYKLTPIH